jgi:hypothetical protein
MLDQFARQGPISPEQLDAAVGRFKKATIERCARRCADASPRVSTRWEKPDDTTNHRNGTGGKTRLTG